MVKERADDLSGRLWSALYSIWVPDCTFCIIYRRDPFVDNIGWIVDHWDCIVDHGYALPTMGESLSTKVRALSTTCKPLSTIQLHCRPLTQSNCRPHSATTICTCRCSQERLTHFLMRYLAVQTWLKFDLRNTQKFRLDRNGVFHTLKA